jgi:hypothetical protein
MVRLRFLELCLNVPLIQLNFAQKHWKFLNSIKSDWNALKTSWMVWQPLKYTAWLCYFWEKWNIFHKIRLKSHSIPVQHALNVFNYIKCAFKRYWKTVHAFLQHIVQGQTTCSVREVVKMFWCRVRTKRLTKFSRFSTRNFKIRHLVVQIHLLCQHQLHVTSWIWLARFTTAVKQTCATIRSLKKQITPARVLNGISEPCKCISPWVSICDCVNDHLARDTMQYRK